MFETIRENRTNTSAAGQNRKHSFFRPILQPKLTINQPNDIYEQEADAMADRVMRMTDHENMGQPFFRPRVFSLQRMCADCEEEEEKMQRKEVDGKETAANNELEDYVDRLNSGGQALPDEVRGFFEPRFGHDFSQVKVHTGTVAAKSAASINSLAYTSGNNIVFNNGQYAPGTETGKRLLAHELTHTVQQNSGIGRRIQRRFNPGRCCNSSDTGADEWALVSKDDPEIPTVWQ